MSRVCVYTCVTGNYDAIVDPTIAPKEIDFICFSDTPIRSNVWQWRKVPSGLQFLSNVKQQRIVKICPHKYLSEYDTSVWVDGNISIVGDIRKFISQYDLSESPLYSRIHPTRNCIYQEAKACIEMKRAPSVNVNKQIEKYKAEGYPEGIGMVETCILLRKHNDIKCVLLDNAWATELLEQSHRDQLSFNYICWKQGFLPGYLTNEFGINDNQFFRMRYHAK